VKRVNARNKCTWRFVTAGGATAQIKEEEELKPIWFSRSPSSLDRREWKTGCEQTWSLSGGTRWDGNRLFCTLPSQALASGLGREKAGEKG